MISLGDISDIQNMCMRKNKLALPPTVARRYKDPARPVSYILYPSGLILAPLGGMVPVA